MKDQVSHPNKTRGKITAAIELQSRYELFGEQKKILAPAEIRTQGRPAPGKIHTICTVKSLVLTSAITSHYRLRQKNVKEIKLIIMSLCFEHP